MNFWLDNRAGAWYNKEEEGDSHVKRRWVG